VGIWGCMASVVVGNGRMRAKSKVLATFGVFGFVDAIKVLGNKVWVWYDQHGGARCASHVLVSGMEFGTNMQTGVVNGWMAIVCVIDINTLFTFHIYNLKSTFFTFLTLFVWHSMSTHKRR